LDDKIVCPYSSRENCTRSTSTTHFRQSPQTIPSIQKKQTQSTHLKVLVLSPRHSTGISPHSETGQDTESDRQRLLRLDGARDAGAGENNTGQKSELDAVGLLVGDSVGAQRVESADGAAGGHGRDAACASVAGDSATSGQGGEEVADLDERLEVELVPVMEGIRLMLAMCCD
jgi:hypothetical protein